MELSKQSLIECEKYINIIKKQIQIREACEILLNSSYDLRRYNSEDLDLFKIGEGVYKVINLKTERLHSIELGIDLV